MPVPLEVSQELESRVLVSLSLRRGVGRGASLCPSPSRRNCHPTFVLRKVQIDGTLEKEILKKKKFLRFPISKNRPFLFWFCSLFSAKCSVSACEEF